MNQHPTDGLHLARDRLDRVHVDAPRGLRLALGAIDPGVGRGIDQYIRRMRPDASAHGVHIL